MVKYFINPFAIAGDVNAIPDDAQPGGSVSYAQGFPVNYEYPQGQPGSLDVPRDSTNQLFFDITSNLQKYQQNGAPFFITPTDNGGSPYSYSIYAVVMYDSGSGMKRYMSKKNSNTDLPSVGASWWVIDNTSNSIIYDNVQFDPSVSNFDVVYFDGTSSTFKKAIANGAVQENAIGIADITEQRIWAFGYCPIFPSGSGIIAGETYYLSETTAGSITNVLPTSNIIIIGIAKSATEVFLNIQKDTSVTQDLSQNGYVYMPGGALFQWGKVIIPAPNASSATFPIIFPIPFQNIPDNPFSVTDTNEGNPRAGLTGVESGLFNITNTGMTAYIDDNFNGNITNNVTIRWMAIGV